MTDNFKTINKRLVASLSAALVAGFAGCALYDRLWAGLMRWVTKPQVLA